MIFPEYFQAHGRPTLKNLVQMWNQMLQKELEHSPSVKTDAAAAFLASLEEPKLTSLAEAGKKPPIEVLPPGMPSLTAAPISIQKKPMPAGQNTQQLPAKPLSLEAPPTAASPVSTPLPQQPGSDPLTTPVSSAPPPPASDTVAAPASDPATEPVSDSVSPTANVPPSLEEAAS